MELFSSMMEIIFDNYSALFIFITFWFSVRLCRTENQREGVISLTPSCASLTEGYAYLPAAGRYKYITIN